MCKALSAAAAFEARSRNPASGPAPEAMASVRGCLSQASSRALRLVYQGWLPGVPMHKDGCLSGGGRVWRPVVSEVVWWT